MKKKYDYPINKYDKSGIKKLMTKLLSIQDDKQTIGSKLTEMRAWLAHKENKHNLKSITTQNILCLCKCLDVIILSKLYTVLEMNVNVITAYQQKSKKDIENNIIT